MLLCISSQPSQHKSRLKRTLHLKCDICDREFIKPFFAHIEQARHHFCSRECQGKAQHKGGLLDIKKRQVMHDRYGVENPQQLKCVREKSRRTNVERYGTEVGSQSEQVKAVARRTNIERYGVEWHTQSENFAEKSAKTWMNKYGVNHPMKSEVVKAKYDFLASWRKAHETKKLNGTYASSKGEKKFFLRLCKLFRNVERQVPVIYENGTWHVDFKIDDTYVQFDGVYWHGLDRSLKEICESDKPRDKVIFARFEHDRYQDVWFTERNMKLIRITDRQEKKLSDDELRRLLTNQGNTWRRKTI